RRHTRSTRDWSSDVCSSDLTQSGLARWDSENWRIFTKRDGLSSSTIQAIADDGDGNLWVGTQGGGLNRLRDGQFTAFRKQEKDRSEERRVGKESRTGVIVID